MKLLHLKVLQMGVYLEIKGSNFDIIKKELNKKNEEILKFFLKVLDF